MLAIAALRVELEPHLDDQDALVGRLLDGIVPGELAERREQVGGLGELGQFAGELRPVTLADAGDQVLFRGEVDVDRAGTDPGSLADVLHGRAVEALSGKALFGGVQDMGAAGDLGGGLELGQGRYPRIASNKTNGRFV